ncbi:MAG TPA: peptidylprolyl isomerase [Planctomycetota bacterium]
MKPGADPAAPGGPGWLSRLNEIGERHATAIIAVSTLLIILTVLLFAKGAYDRSQLERAEQDLAKASTVESLEALKAKFGGTPVASRIVYKLANKYADEGKLDAAIAEYKDFLNRWPLDPFKPQVDTALVAVERNRAFNDERKPVRLKEHTLQSHPRQFPALKDPRLAFGPERPANPLAELQAPSGVVKIELFEDDAPNAVASFVKLVEAKGFDGLKWEGTDGDRRLRTSKKPDAPDALIAYEDTPSRSGEAGSLVLIRDGDGNVAGRFEVLLRSEPGLRNVTVLGIVKDGLAHLKKDETITSLKVSSKRDHVYEPVPLEKKK